MKLKLIRLMTGLLISMGVAGLTGIHAQIIGYPLPGNTDYPDADGRRIDRFICENDKAFNSIVIDEDDSIAYLCSSNLNIPYIVKFDLNTFAKLDTLVLDTGLSKVECAIKNPLKPEIWLGSSEYIIIVDTELFQVKTLVQCDGFKVKRFIFNPLRNSIFALLTGETDCIAEIDPNNAEISSHSFPSHQQTFMTGELSTDGDLIFILTSSSPSIILAIDTEIFEIVNSTVVPGSLPATAIAINPVLPELYVALPGSPALIYRFSLPQLAQSGTVELLSNERPRNFMFCDVSGNYAFINDGDSSSGIIRINTYLFQRDTRLDFGDLHYPACFGRFEDSVIIATENAPGAVIEIQPNEFQVLRQTVFTDMGASAGAVVCSLSPEVVFVAVKNGESSRLVGFDPISREIVKTIDLISVTGSLSFGAGDPSSNNGIWIESGAESYVISVDLQVGELVERQMLPENFELRGMLLDQAGNLFFLTTDALYEIDPETLEINDYYEFSPDLAPAQGFTCDPLNQRLLVAGKNNSGKIWQFSTQPFAVNSVIDLDPTENHALFLTTDAGENNAYMLVKSSPFRIKRFNLESQLFTGNSNLPFNGYYIEKSGSFVDNSQILFAETGFPTKLQRFDVNSFEWLSPIEMLISENIESFGFASSGPYAFMSIAGSNATVARYGITQAHAIHGSKAQMSETSIVDSINFYSHEAGNSVRLAIYDEHHHLVWNSNLLANDKQNEWLRVPVENGWPETLTLDPGQYVLTYQITGDGLSPSSTRVQHEAGIRVSWRFGEFPDQLISAEETDAIWSIYADCRALEASPTPSCSPSPTPSSTPAPSATPTVQPPTPTPTQLAESTTTPTPTPRAGSGVELYLSQSIYQPGDSFSLRARPVNANPSPVSADLYVILDVYGSYWFGPSWQQAPDSYWIADLLGSRDIVIFQFEWPNVDGSAEELRFWSGMIQEGSVDLFGYYDVVEFGYHGYPETPVPTSTPTETPAFTPDTPAPTATPTELPCSIQIELFNEDPMSYAGEHCENEDVYCFSPERLNFCSGWKNIARLTNAGSAIAVVRVLIDGESMDSFEAEWEEIAIQPGESQLVKVRFCPTNPPDNLKQANLILEWPGDGFGLKLKGWCVAG